jgi:heme oxygenase (biliverdin-IX-beta and delta-forming)
MRSAFGRISPERGDWRTSHRSLQIAHSPPPQAGASALAPHAPMGNDPVMSEPAGFRHAGSGSPATSVPEPPFAERARTLVHVARTGTLSTHSRKVAGFPFGSVAPYGVDENGRPTLLVSTMAMHTQNIAADPRASLLVTQPDWSDDPLAGARVTLVGQVERVPDGDGASVREDYLARQPNARYWVDFDDFAFYRMEVVDLYYVAGFGAMGWVEAQEYRGARPDPLADHATGIIRHMNDDHADALVLYCRAFAGVVAAEATMTAVDRMGFRVRARLGEELRGLRINFTRQVHTPLEARTVLVEMVKQARTAS